jgi:hypothetical protein
MRLLEAHGYSRMHYHAAVTREAHDYSRMHYHAAVTREAHVYSRMLYHAAVTMEALSSKLYLIPCGVSGQPP